MNKVYLSHSDINWLVIGLAKIIQINMRHKVLLNDGKCLAMYPIPRGGVPVAYALISALGTGFTIVDTPEKADFFVDDIIDSGETMRTICDQYPGKPFFALIEKTDSFPGSMRAPAPPTYTSQTYKHGDWIVFPWETGDEEGTGVEDNIRRLLQYAGDDPKRGGLLETPKRVAKAFNHWFSGYNVDIASILKVFEDGAEKCDEMVLVKDIPIYSKCEHHMADIFGRATIAYIPNGKIVGLSKLSRVADAYARRLQVQERLTNQIADALDTHLQPKGVGVIIRARHMCMESRGICQQGHHTVTSALRGALKDDSATRAEFMTLAN